MSAIPMLSVRDLRLEVGPRTLVRELSFDARAGELWCLLGPNGIGKTTLLLALAGLRRPEAGAIHLAGKPLGEWRIEAAARQRAFLPQAVHDAFSATVLDTVLIGRHPHLPQWRWENEDDRNAARAALTTVDLDGFAQRDVLTLSGGERQRVAIAGVLVQDAPLLVLDEPVAHLDLRHQAQVMTHLATLARTSGKAIVLSLHDLNLAARYATHAVVFGPQALAACGPVAEVLDESRLTRTFGHPVRRVAIDGQTIFVPE